MKSLLIRIAVLSIATSVVTPAFAQSGASDVYKAKCVMCHGADGAAATGPGRALKAASFKDASIVNASDADLITAVSKGKGKMPAYQGKLSDAQIKAVIAYVRTLQK